ncbi:exocyst complex component 8-like isoform X2 [Sycon ciliatum]|uniref:exocyst complex component 8-like isoform X2 n=1 Tax=Sycon ciliatum TaxID=27933 RepID=UPI0020AC52C1|eukprot:scpid57295/ scgid0291/ Exocyst complex component 8
MSFSSGRDVSLTSSDSLSWKKSTSDYTDQNPITDPLAERLSAPGFDAEAYVRELSRNCVGDLELQSHRKRIQAVSEETSQALKKNVYKNYTQFIETSKEISYLEAEMYQLSHQLTEERLLLQSFYDLSLKDESAQREKKQEKEKTNLASLLETVEGCSQVTEVPGRYVVHQGTLMHLKSETLEAKQLIRAFLLNDSLMLTSILRKRRGPIRYRFLALFELDNLAVVNLKETDEQSNMFKVLMFPDNYVFQTETPEKKAEWLQIIDSTKQIHKYMEDAQKRNAAEGQKKTQDLLSVDWLKEVPEDLDVFLAQRDFEAAVKLVQKTTEYLSDFQHSQAARDIRNRVESRVKNVCQQLVTELQGASGTAGKSNPSAVRRVVAMLVKLGRSAKACELFLKNYSRVIDHHFRQLKIEGNTSLYISRLSSTFFFGLIEAAEEFRKAFSENNDSASAFVVWCLDELSDFVQRFGSQVFGGGNTLSVVAECVHTAAQYCDKLKDVGLELTFQFRSQILSDLSLCLGDSREQLVEQLRHRANAEDWACLDFSKKPEGLSQLIFDMEAFGVDDFKNLVYDGSKVDIARTTVEFCRCVYAFIQDGMKIYIPSLHDTFISCLCILFECQIVHIKSVLEEDAFLQHHDFIRKNAMFIMETFLPIMEEKLEDAFGRGLDQLMDLHAELEDLLAGGEGLDESGRVEDDEEEESLPILQQERCSLATYLMHQYS